MIPTKNSQPAGTKTLTIGKKIHLVCHYKEADNGEKCVFIVYKQKDHKTSRREKRYEGFIIQPGMFVSKDYFEPELYWFEQGIKEIKYTFDLEYKGERIPCNNQVLLVQKTRFILPKPIYDYSKARQPGSTKYCDLSASDIQKIPINYSQGWNFDQIKNIGEAHITIKRTIKDLTIEECRNEFKTLIKAGTFGKFQDVGVLIADKFINGNQSDFEHEIINNEFAIRIRKFLNRKVIKDFHQELKQNKGDISKVILKAGKNIERPKPGELFDRSWFGPSLAILINDYISLNININEYDVWSDISGGFFYKCKLEAIFTDDFSLDYGDMVSGTPTKYIPLFRHWFILQHYKAFGSNECGKPFILKGSFEIEFKGNLLSSSAPKIKESELNEIT